ncbi:MAG TPA: hypothetical protein PLT66_04330 [Bacillota bacterium]|nr:hypothetical protein [Bacillota bacterium]
MCRTGDAYRYWLYYTSEPINKIYMQENAELMNESWLGFHKLDVEMAIDRLRESK